MTHIDVLFDNSPTDGPGKFVAVEDEQGCSIDLGEWVWRKDLGFWAYRIEVEEASHDTTGLVLSNERWAELTEAVKL
jgi:hypothetical protein